MQLITIKESNYSADLMVLKSRLESEGISCFIEGELTSQVLAHIPSFTVKLQVGKNDLKRVKEIMVELGEWQEDKSRPVCPKCGSDEIKLKLSFCKKVKIAFKMFLTFSNHEQEGEAYKNTKYQCKRCECEF